MGAEPFVRFPCTLLEGVADCLWEMNADGMVVSGGPIGAVASADGPWRGRCWLEVVDPVDRGPAGALWCRALASAEPVEATVRLRLSGGAEPVRLRLAPAQGPGPVGHWHGLGRRVAAGEGDDAHRRLIETIDDGFCTLELLRDAEGRAYDYRFLSVNSAFERQSGFSQAEGRTALQLVPDLSRKWLDVYSRIARTGRAERFEEAQEMPLRFFEVYATPVEPPGGSRLAVLFRDILPRKRAEEQLSASERRMTSLVQGMPQLVWRASRDGLWTWASPQWTAFTGQTAAESRGFGWLKAIHPDDRADVVDRWRQAGVRGEFQAEIRIRHSGRGVERWFQARAVPVRDDRGEAAEWIGTCTDIDERYQLQARQEVLLAELQHRTRNLLGVVASVADRTARSSLALDDFLPRFRERLLALSRINGLLSQLDRGQRVTFGELIRAELGARGVLDPASVERVVLEGPEGVRLRSVSVQTFALAVHELATNAVKYGALSGDAGRLVVRWRLGEPAAGPRRLLVEWTESGVVMTARQVTVPGGGYGRELIEKALPYQLKARTSYEIGPDGVRCTIDLPIEDDARV